MVHHKAHAWLEGLIVKGVASYNGQNWVNVLKKIETLYPANTVVYGGRGEAGKLSLVIPQQITYLQTADKIAKEYLASIGGDKTKADYAQLQKLFEKAFPAYSLGNMINYGGYGIVTNLK